ncbi:putative oxidoreductase major subunit [Escherichia coli]|nr:twin-arginine translocation signal domain-containing protein [Escherichia coli]SQB69850.1 putative oxidoreductase major subunit [Escherichia coli]
MKAEISRRSLMKTSALGSLALASSAFTLPFSQIVRAAEVPVEEKAVWSSCTVNCGSRCLLRLHVKDDTEPLRFSWRVFCLSDQAATSRSFSEA